ALAITPSCADPAPGVPPSQPTAAPAPADPLPEAPPRPKATGAADWPTFLGPTRDGVSTEKGIISPWPKDGLKKVWECELGIGFAPPVVADGRLFHFDRFNDKCRLTARDAATGKFLWKYEYDTAYVDQYGYDPG